MPSSANRLPLSFGFSNVALLLGLMPHKSKTPEPPIVTIAATNTNVPRKKPMAIAQKTLKPSRYCAIERFLKVLELIDLNGQIERLDSSIIHKISDASFLYREGLIAGVEVPAISGYSIENATLTPKGAVAMYEWGNIIESHSIASKAKMAFAIAGTFAFTIVTEVGVLLIARSLGLGQ